MSFLVLKAYLRLIYFDFYLATDRFASLYRKIRNYPIRKKQQQPGAVDRICSAVDIACIWYWKEALCLQRSAVATCLLRDSGVSALLVIGSQQMPFRAHAWVEVDGQVANDKAHVVKKLYSVLDKF